MSWQDYDLGAEGMVIANKNAMTEDQKQLVQDNLRLANYVLGLLARKNSLVYSHWDDCFQEAVLAMMAAARCWREGESKFSSYACKAMFRAILKFLDTLRPEKTFCEFDTLPSRESTNRLCDILEVLTPQEQQLAYKVWILEISRKAISQKTGKPYREVCHLVERIKKKLQRYGSEQMVCSGA